MKKLIAVTALVVVWFLYSNQAFAGVFIDTFDNPDQSKENWVAPVNGNPKFVEGRYEIEAEGDENTVSVLVQEIEIETEDGMILEVVGEDMGDARANNFFICFAYVNETEMYIGGPFVGGMQTWNVIHINPQIRAWPNNFIGTPEVLGPNIQYNLRLEIHGDTVEVYGGEVGLPIEKKVEWTFDGGMPVGRIGLGGTNNRARFDDFKVSGPNVPSSAVKPGGKLVSAWGEIKKSYK